MHIDTKPNDANRAMTFTFLRSRMRILAAALPPRDSRALNNEMPDSSEIGRGESAAHHDNIEIRAAVRQSVRLMLGGNVNALWRWWWWWWRQPLCTYRDENRSASFAECVCMVLSCFFFLFLFLILEWEQKWADGLIIFFSGWSRVHGSVWIRLYLAASVSYSA